MAKYNWAAIRDDYEIRGLSYSQLTDKHGVGRGNISTRAKKEDWNKEEIEQLITDKVNSNIALADINKKIEQQYGTRSILIDKEVDRQERLRFLFDTAAEESQSISDLGLVQRDKDLLMMANIHSQSTARNRETLLGKMPQTQVNIQNNTANDADNVIEVLLDKHQ
ncbi:MAG: hypothetical protein R8M45_03540 [Ghiorsea sp.]